MIERSLALGALQLLIGGSFVASILQLDATLPTKLAVLFAAGYWVLQDSLTNIERHTQIAAATDCIEFSRDLILNSLELPNDVRQRHAQEHETFRQRLSSEYGASSRFILIDLIPAAIPVAGSLAIGLTISALLKA